MEKAFILIVEDEAPIAEVLQSYLEKEGYATHHLASGTEVQAFLRANPVSLILLDLMLPGKDGITVCREVRGASDIPIIMVTAKADEIDRLLGLELGADDYICKPFSPREVVARVKAVLRRRPHNTEELLSINGLTINQDTYHAEINGHILNLTSKELQLLVLLVQNPKKVFTRQDLLERCFDELEVSDRVVDSHLKNLRKKLREASDDHNWIKAIYGVGYQFNPATLGSTRG